MYKLPKFAAAASALVLAAPALAVTQVSTPVALTSASIGMAVTTYYNGFVDETAVAGLSASTVFTLSSISADQRTWNFDVLVNNTSSGAITDSRVSIFGFDVDGTLAGASATGDFSRIGLNGNVPQIGPRLDVCFRAGGGGNNCGGGGGGVRIGQSSSAGTFALNFSSATASLVLDNFFVRYRAIEGSDLGSSGIGLVAPLPELATWAMLVIGFGFVGTLRRRRAPGITA